MINFAIPNLEKTIKDIEKADKQIAFANRMAINAAANEIKTELTAEMARVFENPTKYTINSVRIDYAGKKDPASGIRKAEARLYIQDEAKRGNAPADFLRPQVEGGQRQLKKFEARTRAIGLLPSGGFLVPSRSAELDQHGNIPYATFKRILKDLEAPPSATKSSGKRRKAPRAGHKYIIPRGHAKFQGIWLRDNATQKITPVLVWKTSLKEYKKKFKFFDISHSILKSRFEKIFNEKLAHALATAK